VNEQVERYTMEGLLVRDVEIRVMTPKLQRVEVHWHDFYELGFVVDGAARHLVNGVEEALEPGSAFLLSPADFHEISATSATPLTCYNVVIDPRVLERQLDELLPTGSDWVPWTVGGFPEAEPDFSRLWREAHGQREGASILMEALVRCLVVELARRCCPAAGSETDAHLARGGSDVRRAVLFVERHFREPITLADAAAAAHLSPNYFSERFRASTGTSFQVYLQNRRLQFARSLLGSTNLGVTEACHASGFNSPSHFGRAYRRRYGGSPSALRGVQLAHDVAHRAPVDLLRSLTSRPCKEGPGLKSARG